MRAITLAISELTPRENDGRSRCIIDASSFPNETIVREINARFLIFMFDSSVIN
jgi:hypothetical protein